MTYFSDALAGQERPDFLGRLGAFFDRVIAFQSRDVAVRQLEAMTDTQLAEMGIARENIVRHVYRDIYYV